MLMIANMWYVIWPGGLPQPTAHKNRPRTTCAFILIASESTANLFWSTTTLTGVYSFWIEINPQKLILCFQPLDQDWNNVNSSKGSHQKKTVMKRSGWPIQGGGHPPTRLTDSICEKFRTFFLLNMIPWYPKQILLHCEEAEKCIFDVFLLPF